MMRRILLCAALAAVLGTPAMAQIGGPGDGPGGGPGDGANDGGSGDGVPNSGDPIGIEESPFGWRTAQVWGRAITNAIDPNGSDPQEDSDFDHVDQHHIVTSMSDQGAANAVCIGEMKVSRGPIGLTCFSVASGFTNMASDTDPVAATRGEYNCRARTEAGAIVYLGDVDLDPTVADKTVDVELSFTGYSSTSGQDERTVEGWGKITISRKDGTTEEYRVDVIPSGWKRFAPGGDNQVTEDDDFSYSVTVTLGHGDSIGLTSVAEARTTATNSNGVTHQYANGNVNSNIGLTVRANIKPVEENKDAPFGGGSGNDGSGDDGSGDGDGGEGDGDGYPGPLAVLRQDAMTSGRMYS